MRLAQFVRREYPEMTIGEFNQLKTHITMVAVKIMQQAENLHETDTGVYWPTIELTKFSVLNDKFRDYIIQELKMMGMEFIEHNAFYRI